MITTSKFAFIVTSLLALFAGSGCSTTVSKPTDINNKAKKIDLKTAKPNLQKASYTAKTASKATVDEDFDTWERVFRGFQFNPKFNRYPQVQSLVDTYGSDSEQLNLLSERASVFLHMIVHELDRRNMPTELALLPFVESAFDPDIFSHAGAAGLWQFIPSTGRDYGLTQSKLYDARLDPFAATGAALNYLQNLHDEFNGDWFLALAAYNCGENRVQREIDKNKALGLPTDYWSLALPRETRDYVPRLLAFKELISHANHYGIQLPETPNRARLAQLHIDKPVDLRQVAYHAGLEAEQLLSLNPCYRKGITTPQYSNRIVLPRDKAQLLAQLIESLPAAELPQTKKPHLIYAKAVRPVPKQYNKLLTARIGKKHAQSQYASAKSITKSKLRTAQRSDKNSRA